jgi:hypothetical protein
VKHSIAIAALVASSISLSALPVIAQDAGPVVAVKADRQVHRVIRQGGMGPMAGAGNLGLVCSDRGAEELEVALVRLSHRLDLTDSQQPLFDAFRTTALTTQTSFADTCAAALPDTTADAAPDLVERLKSGIAFETARLEAMNAVLPAFEAFYGSLSEEQQASLMPRRGFFMQFDDRGGADRPDRGSNRSLRAPAPGR